MPAAGTIRIAETAPNGAAPVNAGEELAANARVDVGEDGVDARAQDREDTDDDDGDQHQDQGILDEPLAFFTSKEIPKHDGGAPR